MRSPLLNRSRHTGPETRFLNKKRAWFELNYTLYVRTHIHIYLYICVQVCLLSMRSFQALNVIPNRKFRVNVIYSFVPKISWLRKNVANLDFVTCIGYPIVLNIFCDAFALMKFMDFGFVFCCEMGSARGLKCNVCTYVRRLKWIRLLAKLRWDYRTELFIYILNFWGLVDKRSYISRNWSTSIFNCYCEYIFVI